MTFSGVSQQLDTTLFNPYSGELTAVFGQFVVNNQIYKGISTSDILIGSGISDILLVQSPVGTQRICSVETILAFNGFDVLHLADRFIVFDDMTLEGGDQNDLIWANAGDDTIRGNEADDVLDGGPGDDFIDAGSGDDLVTLWPGSGFDIILGGIGTDTVEIAAVQNQITIGPSAVAPYEFDILYLGLPMARIDGIETLVLDDLIVDLTACVAGDCGLCGNGTLNGGEECDDGNNVDDDGCAADCTSEF
jgi:cysteine-rich repeat protein